MAEGILEAANNVPPHGKLLLEPRKISAWKEELGSAVHVSVLGLLDDACCSPAHVLKELHFVGRDLSERCEVAHLLLLGLSRRQQAHQGGLFVLAQRLELYRSSVANRPR